MCKYYFIFIFFEKNLLTIFFLLYDIDVGKEKEKGKSEVKKIVLNVTYFFFHFLCILYNIVVFL